MSEQLKNVLWMAEELDFQVSPVNKAEAESLIADFLERAANTDLSHSVYRT